MSNIKEKVLEAKNKIYRALFRGAPNLFTATDLNRQIQLLTRRLDTIETNLGVIDTDMKMSWWSTTGGTYRYVQLTYSYLRVYGMTIYEGATVTKTVEAQCQQGWTNTTSEVALFIMLDRVTFSNDPTHAISGVDFVGGEQSRPAADHWAFSGTYDIVSKFTANYEVYMRGVNAGEALKFVLCADDNDGKGIRQLFVTNSIVKHINTSIAEVKAPLDDMRRLKFARIYWKYRYENGAYQTPDLSLYSATTNFPADSIQYYSNPRLGIIGFQFMKGGSPAKALYMMLPSNLGSTAGKSPSGNPPWTRVTSQVLVSPFRVYQMDETGVSEWPVNTDKAKAGSIIGINTAYITDPRWVAGDDDPNTEVDLVSPLQCSFELLVVVF